MTPTPIRQVLSTFQKSGVRTLLMGGQACVFYGAAQVSKDVDFLVLAEPENFARLQAALAELQADRIAVPPFDPAALDRGHAVHFRCRVPAAEGLRVDVMTRLRAMPEFEVLWERRTTFVDDNGVEYHLLCIPDLVQAKKTQRSKDWPVIELLVTIHYREHANAATDDRVDFWLREARTPELLVELCRRFPTQATRLTACRPLIRLAHERSLDDLRTALDAEVRAEQARGGLAAYAAHPLFRTVSLDRTFYAPLSRESYVAYAASVPEDFRFVVKAPAAITDPAVRKPGSGEISADNPGFLDARLAVESFVGPATAGLGRKAGPLVFQFPPVGRRLLADPQKLAEAVGAEPRGP